MPFISLPFLRKPFILIFCSCAVLALLSLTAGALGPGACVRQLAALFGPGARCLLLSGLAEPFGAGGGFFLFFIAPLLAALTALSGCL